MFFFFCVFLFIIFIAFLLLAYNRSGSTLLPFTGLTFSFRLALNILERKWFLLEKELHTPC